MRKTMTRDPERVVRLEQTQVWLGQLTAVKPAAIEASLSQDQRTAVAQRRQPSGEYRLAAGISLVLLASQLALLGQAGTPGTVRWEFLTGDGVSSSPAIGVDGTVYVGSYDYNVYALDGVTGAKKWEFLTGSFVSSSPALGADGTV